MNQFWPSLWDMWPFEALKSHQKNEYILVRLSLFGLQYIFYLNSFLYDLLEIGRSIWLHICLVKIRKSWYVCTFRKQKLTPHSWNTNDKTVTLQELSRLSRRGCITCVHRHTHISICLYIYSYIHAFKYEYIYINIYMCV